MNKLIHISTHKGQKTHWISQNLLMQYTGVSDLYVRDIRRRYKQSVDSRQRGMNPLPITGKSWRWARWGNEFYYDYDSIPNQAPARYNSQLPDL
jgi:hypothetical protein